MLFQVVPITKFVAAVSGKHVNGTKDKGIGALYPSKGSRTGRILGGKKSPVPAEYRRQCPGFTTGRTASMAIKMGPAGWS